MDVTSERKCKKNSDKCTYNCDFKALIPGEALVRTTGREDDAIITNATASSTKVLAPVEPASAQ